MYGIYVYISDAWSVIEL